MFVVLKSDMTGETAGAGSVNRHRSILSARVCFKPTHFGLYTFLPDQVRTSLWQNSSAPRIALQRLVATSSASHLTNIHPHFFKNPSMSSQELISQGSPHTTTPFLSSCFDSSPSNIVPSTSSHSSQVSKVPHALRTLSRNAGNGTRSIHGS